jgi:hypothetical protein
MVLWRHHISPITLLVWTRFSLLVPAGGYVQLIFLQLQCHFSLLWPHKQDDGFAIAPNYASPHLPTSRACGNRRMRRWPARRALLRPWARTSFALELYTSMMRLNFGIVSLTGTMRARFQPPKHPGHGRWHAKLMTASPHRSGSSQLRLQARARTLRTAWVPCAWPASPMPPCSHCDRRFRQPTWVGA